MGYLFSFDTVDGFQGNYLNIKPSFISKTTVSVAVNYWICYPVPSGVQPCVPKTCLRSFTFTYDLESDDNVYVQAYIYMATLPEFAGAVPA